MLLLLLLLLLLVLLMVVVTDQVRHLRVKHKKNEHIKFCHHFPIFHQRFVGTVEVEVVEVEMVEVEIVAMKKPPANASHIFHRRVVLSFYWRFNKKKRRRYLQIGGQTRGQVRGLGRRDAVVFVLVRFLLMRSSINGHSSFHFLCFRRKTYVVDGTRRRRFDGGGAAAGAAAGRRRRRRRRRLLGRRRSFRLVLALARTDEVLVAHLEHPPIRKLGKKKLGKNSVTRWRHLSAASAATLGGVVVGGRRGGVVGHFDLGRRLGRRFLNLATE